MNSLQKKYLKKMLHLNFLAFPFFAIMTSALIILESITYPGFVQNHLILSPEVFFSLLVISAYLVVAGRRVYKKTDHLDVLAKITGLFLPASIVVGSIFLSVEKSNYRGYVYTHGFHFDPIYFYYLYAISILILLVSMSKYIVQFGQTRSIKTHKIFISILALSIFWYYIFLNMGIAYQAVKPKLGSIVKNINADSLWKGRYLFGDFYDYMMFVNKYTPNNAVLMRMTQQSKWPAISNDGYVRGFIYPRKTKVGDENYINDPDITHIFIHRAYSPPRVDKYIEKWPTFPVKAKKLMYMRDNDFTKEPIIVDGDYDPSNHTYDDLWGIVFLEK